MARASVLSYDVPEDSRTGDHALGEFGDKFRKAREKKDLSLDDVSNVTKISTRMLQAIEEQHFDELPGGVFNRGFIRAYAKHLGLDAEEAVNDYLACLRQEQVDSHAGWDTDQRPRPRSPIVAKPAAAAPPEEAPKPQVTAAVEELPDLQLPRVEHLRSKKEYLGRPSSGTPGFLIASVAVLLIVLAFFWIRHARSVKTVAANSTPAPAVSQPAMLTPTALAPTPTVATATAPSEAAAKAVQPVRSTPAPAPHAPALTTPPAENPATTAKVLPKTIEVKSDVTIRNFEASTGKSAAKSPASFTVVVRAQENSWISVTADGQLLTQETLIAPAATSFHANRELVVRVGNAAGVSFLWKGEELQAHGAESEAKTFIFDAEGMHAATSSQAPAQAPAQP